MNAPYADDLADAGQQENPTSAALFLLRENLRGFTSD
jgi:hypothetical protein